VTILAIIYNKYKDIDWLKKILSYLRPAVIAMIAISGLTLLGDAVHFGHNTSYFALVMFIVSFVLLVKYKVNPIIIMVACGILEVIINML
jgi:chromate transporter